MSVLSVVHRTSFDYAAPVTASYNEARMRPATDRRQTVRSSRLDVRPNTWADEYRDFWGTAVTAIEVLRSHERLEIVAESVVEVDVGQPDEPSITWERLGGDIVLDAYAPFLVETSTTAVPDDVAALALDAAGGLAPGAAAEAICLAVRDRLEYVPGVTTVHTPGGRGVGGPHRRVPGHGAPRDRRPAIGRHPREVRLGVPAPEAGRGGRRDGGRRVARLAGVVGR